VSAFAEIAGLVREIRTRRPGRTSLTEPEAQQVTRSLGIAVPLMKVVAGPDDNVSLPGDRVVVKAIGPTHKTDIGGVRVAANTPLAIAAAIQAIAAEIGPIREYLVAEHIDHDPLAEIIAGVRWSDAFGPVVSIGPGGVGVGVGPAPAIIAPATADRIEATLRSSVLTETRRGAPPAATVTDLTALATTLLAFGEAVMPHDLAEFEINPIVFTAAGPIALDALAIVGRGDGGPTRPDRPIDGIARQLHPRSIAVMGVSEQMNPGRVILRNVLAAGFPGNRVVVIKPGVAEIEGCRCIPDLTALGDPVDLLVVAVPAAAVPEVVEQAMELGSARSMVLIPGGLGERPGTEAAADRIRKAIASCPSPNRPVITGPNSMGIRSVPGGYDATFIPAERMTLADPPSRRLPPGTRDPAQVAVVAQSGAFTLARLDRLPWLHPRYVVTAGNQIHLTIGDYLEHLAAEPEVAIIACYLEGFLPGDGDRTLRAAMRMRARGGLVLWYRGGRTDQGAQSAATHTAAIATDDLVVRSLARTAGVLEAESLDDFDDLLRIAVAFHDRPVGGAHVAVVSNAGFECVAAADNVGSLTFAEYSSATRSRLAEILHGADLAGVTGIGNPLDLTPMAGDATYAAAVEAVLDDPGVEIAVVGCLPFTPALRTMPEQVGWKGSLPDRLAALATHSTPWIAVVDGGRQYDPMADHLEAAGIPVVRAMDRAMRLLDRWARSRA
jgi:acyl-CoA synthetase (NDP forming)